MGEHKMPAGVVIRMGDVAARAVGFAPAAPPPKPKRRRKADAEDSDD